MRHKSDFHHANHENNSSQLGMPKIASIFAELKPNFIDDIIVLCVGLWNLNVIQNL